MKLIVENHKYPAAWANPVDLWCDGYSHTFYVRSEQPGTPFLDGGVAIALYREEYVEYLNATIDRMAVENKDLIYRNKFLRERKDLLSDRIPAYNEFVRLQEENKLLREKIDGLG